MWSILRQLLCWHQWIPETRMRIILPTGTKIAVREECHRCRSQRIAWEEPRDSDLTLGR